MPRTLHPTRAGWVFFAMTFGVGFAALNTGNNLLYMVLALLLSFLVLSGVLSESALRGIEVRRRVPAECFAEASAPVVLEISNRQRRVPSFAIVVEDRAGPDAARSWPTGRVFALRIEPGETLRRAYALRPEQRGELPFAGVRVATRFPFGLFSKAMWIDLPGSVLVYPAIDRDGRRGRAPDDPLGSVAREGRGTETPASAGLRGWTAGEPLRRVHWRSSLRRGALLVRESEREGCAIYMVRLATANAEAGAAFERAVRRAASEAVAHLDAGYRVGIETGAVRIDPGQGHRQRRRLLAHLARVAPEREAAA